MIEALRTLFAPAPPLPVQLALPCGVLPLHVCRNPRARRLSLRVCAATRSVRLTVPARLGEAHALAFLERHHDWLLRETAARLPAPVPFAPGTRLPVAGRELLLLEGEGRVARLVDGALRVPGRDSVYAGRVKRWLREEALLLLDRETRLLAATIGRPVQQVRVGDFRSRWGSCSSDGRIAYSWRLLLAPPFVRRAVVAHEVAHLVELNHGPGFWRLATRLLGGRHDEARRWLKANAPLLLRYGATR